MEFVLTKKIRHWRAIILLLSIVVLCLSGCTLRDTSIFNKEITMQCEDPYFVTTYSKTENGTGTRETYLEIDGEVYEVALYYRSTIFAVHMQADTSTKSEILLSGTWKEHKGNLILYVEEDSVFENQYETIVLRPMDSSSS